MATSLSDAGVQFADGSTQLSNAGIGQCRLTLSGGSLKLSPFNGTQITINGTAQSIPSAGVTLAATGLSAATLYYIYAWMNAGVMTLEASTTTHVQDPAPANRGVEIKNGDSTRTLVGMAYCPSAATFADSGTQRLVASWFNRQRKVAINDATAGATTTSATLVELNTANRLQFITWGAELVTGSSSLSVTSSSSGSTVSTSFGIDGNSNCFGQLSGGTAVTAFNFAPRVELDSLAEGFHYASTLALISGGATLTLIGGGTSSTRLSING